MGTHDNTSVEEFTKSDLELLLQLIQNTPLQGTLMTLPEMLQTMTALAIKLQAKLAKLQEAA